MLIPNSDDLSHAFSAKTTQAGVELWAKGYVQIKALQGKGGTIEAQVQGGQRYNVSISLVPAQTGGVAVLGRCTCPVGFNCKHAAAVMMEVLDQLDPLFGDGDDVLEVDAEPTKPQLRESPPSSQPTMEITQWLNSLAAVPPDDTEAYPPSIRRRMVYVLGPSASHALEISLVAIEFRKDGTLAGNIRCFHPFDLRNPAQQPKFLRPSDRRILNRLIAFGQTSDQGEEFADTLRLALATGRARWDRHDGAALQEGPARAGSIVWRTLDNGTQRPAVTLTDDRPVFRGDPHWYVDTAAGQIGAVTVDLPRHLQRALLEAPAVPPELAVHVSRELATRAPAHALPAPVELAPAVVHAGPPVPTLRLSGEMIVVSDPFPNRWREPPPPITLPVAWLSFRYGPHVAQFGEPFATSGMKDGQLFRVHRDMAAEARHARELANLDLLPLGRRHNIGAPPRLSQALALSETDPFAWFDVVENDLPALREAGWDITIDASFPLRLASLSGDITARISDGSGIDWFDLELDTIVDGERIDLLPLLTRWIASVARNGGSLDTLLGDDDEADDLPLLLPLPDGRLLKLDAGRLRPFLAIILELFGNGDVDPESGRTRLSRRAMGDLALAESVGLQAGIVWHGGDALRALGRQLRETSAIPPAPVPAHLAGVLRPYQERGVAWLQFLRMAGLGGVLGDDMGLGKTVQALTHLCIEHEAGRLLTPALVICPTSLVPNWRSEAARFAPNLRVLPLHGPARHGEFGRIGQSDLVITTYPLLTRDHETLLAQDWHIVILDEAQTIKNPAATTTKFAAGLRGSQRLCLSGTPLENHLGELWSLFDFLMPGFLGDRTSFNRLWRNPIEKGGDTDRQAALARRVTPFLLRRTKDEVAADLPAKTEIVEEIAMERAQTAIYEGIRLTMHAKVKAAVAARGLARSGIIILDALLKLRQACCDPRLLKLAGAKAAKAKSAKLDRLMEMVPELLSEGRSILLFSQFTSMLALIEAALIAKGIPYVLLTGNTKDRATPVRRFQAGEVKLFLISLKAGGTGLNLTAADTVIHYDPWWNPAVENQATDRAHRIGQDKPVFVHRLITQGTIEEKMQGLKARKQALVDGILNGAAGKTLAISEADIDDLFAPLG
jgi:hypothetical protein